MAFSTSATSAASSSSAQAFTFPLKEALFCTKNLVRRVLGAFTEIDWVTLTTPQLETAAPYTFDWNEKRFTYDRRNKTVTLFPDQLSRQEKTAGVISEIRYRMTNEGRAEDEIWHIGELRLPRSVIEQLSR
jgi:hypothetical protein